MSCSRSRCGCSFDSQFKIAQQKPKKTVSIITGNSNSGSACIAELFAKFPSELNVRGVFRTEEKAKAFRDKYANLEVVTGVDAKQPETLVKAFYGADSALIVHPLDMAANGVNDAQLSVNMINAAVENGVKYIVYVGSFTAEPPFDDTIIAARFKPSEALLKKLHDEKGVKYTILRGGTFMENLEQSFKSIKESSTYAAPDFPSALVYTKDIGKSAAHCLAAGWEKHDGKIYNMNGSELLGPQDTARIISKVLGREVKATPLGAEQLKVMPAPIAELYERLIKASETGAVPKQNDIQGLVGETSTFEQFIRDNIDKLQ